LSVERYRPIEAEVLNTYRPNALSTAGFYGVRLKDVLIIRFTNMWVEVAVLSFNALSPTLNRDREHLAWTEDSEIHTEADKCIF
jgi:hypothetical protein